MKLSKLLIYVAVLAAAVSWLYFYEIRYRHQQKADEEKAAKLLQIDRDKVSQIVLTSEKHGAIELMKPVKDWVVAVPVQTKADEEAVTRLVASAAGAQSERVLEPKDAKWEEYGLDKPELTVTLAGADRKGTLFIGAQNPSKSSYYARVEGDPRLFLIADTLRNSFNKSVFDLREKTVAGIAPSDVDTVILTRDEKVTEFQREGLDKWRMLKPDQVKVKESVLNKFLVDITNLAAKEIIDTPDKQGDPYGLEHPREMLTLSGKKLEQTVLIGSSAKTDQSAGAGNDVWAQIKGRDAVYRIDGRALSTFKVDTDQIRDKSLVEVKPTDVERLEIELDGTKWLAVKDADREWTLESPEKTQVETWQVTSVIWDLKGTQWKTITMPAPADLASVHMDRPQLVVSLSVKDAKAPITVKAGWEKKPAQKDKEPDKKDEAGGEKETSAGKAATDDAMTRRKAPPDIPDTVNVMVEPHEETGALFTVEGDLVARIREALEGMLKKK